MATLSGLPIVFGVSFFSCVFLLTETIFIVFFVGISYFCRPAGGDKNRLKKQIFTAGKRKTEEF